MSQNQTIKFTVIAGTEEAKQSPTLWTGRQIGKQVRKDVSLSAAILPCTETELQGFANYAKLAILLTDETAAYIRRVKMQRMELGDSIELTFNYEQMLDILTSPATRIKKLVSTSSIRALILSSDYRTACATILGAKLDNWKRIADKEMLFLAVAQDAAVATDRASIRDAVVVRCMEIAAIMPQGDNRMVLEAAAELLADVPVADLDNSI